MLGERYEPQEALQRWAESMLDHAMTDNGLLEAIALTGSKPDIDCSTMILGAASELLERAEYAGTTRRDITPDDLLRLVIGIGLANDDPQHRLPATARDARRDHRLIHGAETPASVHLRQVASRR